MGVLGKLEVEVDIKSSGDVFHELFGSTPHDLCNITPEKIHGCEVHDGEIGKPGSVLHFDYTLEGKKCTVQELVEAIDEENKLVRFKVIGGTLLEEFKSLTVTLQVIDKGEISAVKWIAEFEKFDDYGPYPTSLMNYAIEVTKDIESHHLQA